MITISLFPYCKKVFILTNIWMTWKKSVNIITEKQDFYSHLNMEDITESDNSHSKRVCKDFRNMVLETYELDPVKLLSAPGLAQQATLKKTKVELDPLTDIDMLLMVEKGIRRRICHSIYQYANANNRYMRDYDKNKESLYIQYWDVNNLYGQQFWKSFQ